MTFNPALPIVTIVELQINGVWTDISARARGAGQVVIKTGKSPNASQGEASQMSCILGNPDGWLTEDNPLSPWFGFVGRGCPIRVSLSGVLASPQVRFFGSIDTMLAVNPGGPDATMAVTAVGQINPLGQGNVFQSAMYRTIQAASPVAHWPLEDGSGSSRAASAMSGLPALMPNAGTVTFGAARPGGSTASVDFSPGGSLVGQVPPLSGEWSVAFAYKLTTTASRVMPLTFNTSDGITWQIVVDPTGTPNITVFYFIAGTGFGSSVLNGAVGDLNWHSVQLALSQVGSNITVNVNLDGGNLGAFVPYTGTVPNPTAMVAGPAFANGTHAFFMTQLAVTPSSNGISNLGNSVSGFTGELASLRFSRVCTEEGIAVATSGPSRVAMGPQPLATLTDILHECENADQGIMHDQSSTGAVSLVTVPSMENVAAALAITTNALEPDPGASWDSQGLVNDVTSSRSGGSSAHLSDEANVAKVKQRYAVPRRVNVSTDDQLILDAGWALNVGTAPGPRVPALGLNLRNPNAATYASQVIAVGIGSRMTVAASALPPQFPPDGLDLLVTGWTETLDAVTWLWRPVCVPYSPYKVAVYGTARYDSKTSTLNSGATTASTSLSVATTGGTLWATGAASFDIFVAGARMHVTNITGAASPQTFTVSGPVNGVVKALPAGSVVRLWDTPRYGH